MDADALLVSRLLAGDGDALVEIMNRFSPLVYGVARRITMGSASAEDVVQDVFVELWRRPDRFDANRGSLRAFLAVQAHRRAVDSVRTTVRRNDRDERYYDLESALGALAAFGASPADQAEQGEVSERVRDAVNQLPAEQRIVIEMAYVHGRTQREIAIDLGIPEGTAKSRIRLAQSKLKTLLARELIEFS